MVSIDHEVLMQWHEWGYAVLSKLVPHKWCDEAKRDIEGNPHHWRKQDERYEYSGAPRIQDAWRWSSAVRAIAMEPAGYVQELTGMRAFPFQTINFIRGSEQPLHQDALHFDTWPPGMMVGTWCALEDVDEDNGALVICAGSHWEPLITFRDLGLEIPEYGAEFTSYALYEAHIRTQVAPRYERTRMSVPLDKGDVLIWQANLLHGGGPIKDPEATRWSQATHMYLHGAERYYCPMFSDPSRDVWADKKLSDRDILGLGVPK